MHAVTVSLVFFIFFWIVCVLGVCVLLCMFAVCIVCVSVCWKNSVFVCVMNVSMCLCVYARVGATKGKANVGVKTAKLYAWVALQTLPEEMVISPCLLDFLEKALETIPITPVDRNYTGNIRSHNPNQSRFVKLRFLLICSRCIWSFKWSHVIYCVYCVCYCYCTYNWWNWPAAVIKLFQLIYFIGLRYTELAHTMFVNQKTVFHFSRW